MRIGVGKSRIGVERRRIGVGKEEDRSWRGR